MADGRWEAFMADRFQEQLDDEIKKVHKEFYLASQHLEPEELLDSLPITLPMTHMYEEEGSTMFGIANYPIDQ
eukprot:9850767-Prorocentrum_lima.AAC.1